MTQIAKPEMDAEQFLKTIKDHKATILHDCGIYRHVRCAKPDSGMGSWDVTTWPGYLCFSGDMGDYTFSRLEDMFKFFRRSTQEINPDYWSQKVQSQDRADGIEKYSPEAFCEIIQADLDDAEASEELREEVQEEVLAFAYDGRDAAIGAAMNFEHDDISFDGICECRLSEYTYRFLFCCHAIVWTIQQYDAMKA